MKIFEIIGGAIYSTEKTIGYHNCKVIGGGHDANCGFYAEIQAIGQEDMFSFRINDTIVYDEILQAYLCKETIGVILL